LNLKRNLVSSQLPAHIYSRDNYIRTFKGDIMTDTVQDTQEQSQAQAGENSNELTINDLNAMKIIIDIASSRGAFKPNEMVAVGQTYTKLESFLGTVAKQAEAQKAAAPAGA